MNVIRKNITTIFMLPTLKIDREKIRENGLINAYVKDENKEVHYEGCLYVLFKPTDDHLFKMFVDEEYERTKSLIEDYDYDGGFVVLVYELNSKFNEDFELIRQGRYSSTSEEFQRQFPKIVRIVKNGLRRDEISLQYRVFNKTPDLKKYWEDRIGIEFTDNMEYWQGFIEEEEVLNIEKIKEVYYVE